MSVIFAEFNGATYAYDKATGVKVAQIEPIEGTTPSTQTRYHDGTLDYHWTIDEAKAAVVAYVVAKRLEQS